MNRVVGSLLLAASLPILLVGLSFALYAIAFNYQCGPDAPICRSSWPGGFIISAVVLGSGLVHVVAGAGIWRRKRWAQILGLVLAIGALALTANLAQSVFTVQSFADLDPTRPGLEPNIDTNGRILTVVMALTYGLVTILLLVSLIGRASPKRSDAGEKSLPA